MPCVLLDPWSTLELSTLERARDRAASAALAPAVLHDGVVAFHPLVNNGDASRADEDIASDMQIQNFAYIMMHIYVKEMKCRHWQCRLIAAAAN